MKAKLLWLTYLLILILLGAFILNICLARFYGLGNPVIYDDNTLYGYRPLPNQELIRFSGKRIKINNLSLRCNTDWDTLKENKILFLGNSVTYGGSYIDNNELFSALAVKNKAHLMSASGGVNGWGIGNIHAWLLQTGFYPAKQYVSVLLEGDFHRGVTLIGGTYFVTRKPYSALHEVANHYLTTYLQKQQGHFTGEFTTNRRMKSLIEEDAIRKLKQIDDTLKSKGFKHTIFISPSAGQVFRNDPIDKELKQMAERYGLRFIYLLAEIKQGKYSEKEIFHDVVHLEVKGHEIWAEKIRKHLNL